MTSTPTTEAPDAATSVQPAPAQASERPLVNVRAIERGGDLQLTNALVGGALGERVAVTRGFVRTAFGGRSLELHQGAAGMIASAGGATIERAGAQAIVSAGSVRMQQAGSGIALARSVDVERGGVVVLGLSPRLTVHDGGRVILGPAASLAVLGALAVVAVGIVAALRGRSRRAPEA